MFFIVKSGNLEMSTEIEIESFNQFPTEYSTWEILKATRKVKYNMKKLGPGDMFGHEELVNYEGKVIEKPRRRVSVEAKGEAEVYYLNKSDFLRCKFCVLMCF